MRPSKPSVCVIGLGYIGLPTAAILAGAGFSVTGVDIDDSIVRKVNTGQVHIVEPDLDKAVSAAVQSGALKASNTPDYAEIFIITVPTPLSENKLPVVDYIFSAAKSIAPYLKPGNLIILESTSPVGTTEKLSKFLSDIRIDLVFPTNCNSVDEIDVSVAYCPERVLPGNIINELKSNDRCVGGLTNSCTLKARQFYEIFVNGACIGTNARLSEMVKLAENSFRDLNIAFANELSMICDQFDINVWELIELANRHPRVNILQPGPGVGGHCIAVDPWFIVHSVPEHARLIRAAREVNDNKVQHVIQKIMEIIEIKPNGKVVCLGIAFKCNIDDVRESPALNIVTYLAKETNNRIAVVEPFIHRLPNQLLDLGVIHQSLELALHENDIIVLLVDHDAFKDIEICKLNDKIVYDTRGIWRRGHRNL